MEFIFDNITNNVNELNETYQLDNMDNVDMKYPLKYPYSPMQEMEEYYFFHRADANRTTGKYSQSREVQTILRNIVTPIICILGFLGNIVNIIVLSRLQLLRTNTSKDNGTHLGLIVLAVSDMLFCLSMFPRFLVSESSSIFSHMDFRWFYQMYGTGVVTCFMLTSTWITVVMAVMRYLGICHPFSSRKIDGPIFSKVAYATVFVVSLIVTLPSFFMYKTVKTMGIGQEALYIMDIGVIDQSSSKGQAFIWGKALFGIFIPMAILSYCNLLLIRVLRKSYRMRQQFRVPNAGSNNSNRITLTLIVIMMTFLILVFPSEIMDLVHDHIDKKAGQIEILLTVRSFANVFQIINFAFNFILYCVINVHFRGMLLQMLPCCHRLFPGVLAKFQKSINRAANSRSQLTQITMDNRNSDREKNPNVQISEV